MKNSSCYPDRSSAYVEGTITALKEEKESKIEAVRGYDVSLDTSAATLKEKINGVPGIVAQLSATPADWTAASQVETLNTLNEFISSEQTSAESRVALVSDIDLNWVLIKATVEGI